MGALYNYFLMQLKNMPWIRKRHSLDKKTRNEYTRILLYFARMVERKFRLKSAFELTQDHYAWYINHLTRRGLKRSTINKHKSVLKQAFKALNISITVKIRRV